MLATQNRLRHRADFAYALRHGQRAGAHSLVVHLALAQLHSGVGSSATEPVRVGFAVSKQVGGSVVRHRVARRLRPLVRELIDSLPAGAIVVVRALPAAPAASSAQLRADLASSLRRASARAVQTVRPVSS